MTTSAPLLSYHDGQGVVVMDLEEDPAQSSWARRLVAVTGTSEVWGIKERNGGEGSSGLQYLQEESLLPRRKCAQKEVGEEVVIGACDGSGWLC